MPQEGGNSIAGGPQPREGRKEGKGNKYRLTESGSKRKGKAGEGRQIADGGERRASVNVKLALLGAPNAN